MFCPQIRTGVVAAMSDDNAAAARTPADFLKSIKGKPVVVKLNSGVDYRGMSWCDAGCGPAPVPHLYRLCVCRDPCLPGRVHEHRHGTDRGGLRLTWHILICTQVTHQCGSWQEYVQGQLKNRYGDAFIRGNNGMTACYVPKPLELLSTECTICCCFLAVLYISTIKQ